MEGEPADLRADADESKSRTPGRQRARTTLYLVDENGRKAAARSNDRPNLLAAALDETVLETAMRHRRAVQTPPNRFTVVAQSESTRSASAAGGADGGSALPFSTSTITDASDFATLVERVDETLTAWEGTETTAVLDGVESAVEREGEEATFRFLHVLTRAVTTQGARMSVTLDPAVVDPTVFEPLFDEVVDERTA